MSSDVIRWKKGNGSYNSGLWVDDLFIPESVIDTLRETEKVISLSSDMCWQDQLEAQEEIDNADKIPS